MPGLLDALPSRCLVKPYPARHSGPPGASSSIETGCASPSGPIGAWQGEPWSRFVGAMSEVVRAPWDEALANSPSATLSAFSSPANQARPGQLGGGALSGDEHGQRRHQRDEVGATTSPRHLGRLDREDPIVPVAERVGHADAQAIEAAEPRRARGSRVALPR